MHTEAIFVNLKQWEKRGGFFMAKNKYSTSDLKFQEWINQGRGSGRNEAYKPWLTVRDVPSEGRSHRIFGHKSQRTHHFLSDLELAVFLLLEWQTDIVEIREQFPLQREITLELAKKSGIAHPEVAGVIQYMSSDFLVNSLDREMPKFALQAKYAEDLTVPRTIEKLELERRYWEQKGVPWFLVTEKDIPKVVFKNINWLYPAQRIGSDVELLIQRTQFYSTQFKKYPENTLVEICKQIDAAYELELGESLGEIRELLAKRCFKFDIFRPVTELKAVELELGNVPLLTEALHVAN